MMFPSTVYQEVIKLIQPIILGQMILYFERYDPENLTALYETLGYAAAMSLCTIGLSLLHHLYFYHVQRTGMKIRVAMCHMIYNKVSRWAGATCLCFLKENMKLWSSLNAAHMKCEDLQIYTAFSCG